MKHAGVDGVTKGYNSESVIYLLSIVGSGLREEEGEGKEERVGGV